ncbi:MAG: TlpA disulfide reductase family protein [Usitatibacter sp.]
MRAAFTVAALLACLPAVALESGGVVPNVTLPRLGTVEPPPAIASLKGRVVYVDFWASWCVPCRLSMPALDALYKKHSAAGLTVIGVNKDTSPDAAQKFLERVPVGFPLARDEQDTIAKAFDVKAMPSGYLIDRKGVVRKVHRGFTAETAGALERQIEDLLKESA